LTRSSARSPTCSFAIVVDQVIISSGEQGFGLADGRHQHPILVGQDTTLAELNVELALVAWAAAVVADDANAVDRLVREPVPVPVHGWATGPVHVNLARRIVLVSVGLSNS
jgi:hypothetical protein